MIKQIISYLFRLAFIFSDDYSSYSPLRDDTAPFPNDFPGHDLVKSLYILPLRQKWKFDKSEIVLFLQDLSCPHLS